MQVNKDLIDRFFANKCTPHEVEAIIMYFTHYPNELDKYIGKEEWDSISQKGELDPVLVEKMEREIRRKLFKLRPTRVVPLFQKTKKWIAAASVIIAICSAILIIASLNNKLPQSAETAKINISDQQQKPFTSTTSVWQIRHNPSSHKQKIVLEDGSHIILSPKSTVQYPAPFAHDKRSILLEGEAFFEVAKNKHKPFTVIAGSLSTTALGTSFTITSKKEAHTIRVQLFTGKVVVASTKNIRNWSKDILLNAGQQLAYNGDQPIVTPLTQSLIAKEKIAENNKRLSIAVQKHELIFSNSSLTDVLKDLSAFFHTNIQYTDADLQKMNFTGNFTRTDDIKAVLKVITQMNGLELNETVDGFTIIKPK